MKRKGMYCKICDKVTTHTTVAYGGLPWHCTNKHPGGNTQCHNCGAKLDEIMIKISKALGAETVICKKCRAKTR